MQHEKPARHGYCRRRDLQRLLPLTRGQLAGGLLDDDRAVVGLLAQALARESRWGLAGTWFHDPARHRLLRQAFRSEVAWLRSRGDCGAADQR